jgi:hypothetical protein
MTIETPERTEETKGTKRPPLKHIHWTSGSLEYMWIRICDEYPPPEACEYFRAHYLNYKFPDPLPPDRCTLCIEIWSEIVRINYP